MKKSTADILALYEVPARLFEDSLRRHLQIQASAVLLNQALHMDIEDSEPVPAALTAALYETIMTEMEAQLRIKVDGYEGKVPISAFDLVLLMLRLYDELKKKYGFSEFELAAAGKSYKTRALEEIGRKIQQEVAKITLAKPVKAL